MKTIKHMICIFIFASFLFSCNLYKKLDANSTPKEPANLRATFIDDNLITIEWDEVDEIVGYFVYKSTDNIIFSKVDTYSAKTVYSDENVIKNSKHYYKVSSYSKYGESEKNTTIEVIASKYYSTITTTTISNHSFDITGNIVDACGTFNNWKGTILTQNDDLLTGYVLINSEKLTNGNIIDFKIRVYDKAENKWNDLWGGVNFTNDDIDNGIEKQLIYTPNGEGNMTFSVDKSIPIVYQISININDIKNPKIKLTKAIINEPYINVYYPYENVYEINHIQNGQTLELDSYISKYTFIIENLGNTELVLSGNQGISVFGDNFSLYKDVDNSVIEPRGTSYFSILNSPVDEITNYSGYILIESNDPNNSLFIIYFNKTYKSRLMAKVSTFNSELFNYTDNISDIISNDYTQFNYSFDSVLEKTTNEGEYSITFNNLSFVSFSLRNYLLEHIYPIYVDDLNTIPIQGNTEKTSEDILNPNLQNGINEWKDYHYAYATFGNTPTNETFKINRIGGIYKVIFSNLIINQINNKIYSKNNQNIFNSTFTSNFEDNTGPLLYYKVIEVEPGIIPETPAFESCINDKRVFVLCPKNVISEEGGITEFTVDLTNKIAYLHIDNFDKWENDSMSLSIFTIHKYGNNNGNDITYPVRWGNSYPANPLSLNGYPIILHSEICLSNNVTTNSYKYVTIYRNDIVNEATILISWGGSSGGTPTVPLLKYVSGKVTSW